MRIIIALVVSLWLLLSNWSVSQTAPKATIVTVTRTLTCTVQVLSNNTYTGTCK